MLRAVTNLANLRPSCALVVPVMRIALLKLPALADVFRAAAVLPCWPRCFDASIEAYASRDPTS